MNLDNMTTPNLEITTKRGIARIEEIIIITRIKIETQIIARIADKVLKEMFTKMICSVLFRIKIPNLSMRTREETITIESLRNTTEIVRSTITRVRTIAIPTCSTQELLICI